MQWKKYLSDSSAVIDVKGVAPRNELENVGVREHTHEHMDCFGRFTAMFDKNLDNFLKSKNISKRDFMKICQRSYQSAQEDGQDNMGTMLVDLLLATSEYDTFCVMMSNKYRERQQRGDFGDDETVEEGKCSRDESISRHK